MIISTPQSCLGAFVTIDILIERIIAKSSQERILCVLDAMGGHVPRTIQSHHIPAMISYQL